MNKDLLRNKIILMFFNLKENCRKKLFVIIEYIYKFYFDILGC